MGTVHAISACTAIPDYQNACLMVILLTIDPTSMEAERAFSTTVWYFRLILLSSTCMS